LLKLLLIRNLKKSFLYITSVMSLPTETQMVNYLYNELSNLSAKSGPRSSAEMLKMLFIRSLKISVFYITSGYYLLYS